MNYTPDMVSSGLKMTAALVLVLATVLLAAWIARRFLSRRTSVGGPGLRILASQYVGVKKNIMLLEVPGSVLVLGVTGDRISLLDKIEDTEALKKMEQQGDTRSPVSFLTHLNQFRKRAGKTEN
jgi:flagellar protein FliO/FliZ